MNNVGDWLFKIELLKTNKANRHSWSHSALKTQQEEISRLNIYIASHGGTQAEYGIVTIPFLTHQQRGLLWASHGYKYEKNKLWQEQEPFVMGA